MSTITPVIGKGSGGALAVATLATLPKAGSGLTIEVAAIIAAALVVWGLGYTAIRNYKRGQ